MYYNPSYKGYNDFNFLYYKQLKYKKYNNVEMGGEHDPVLVYGFITDIVFIEDDGFNLCVTGDTGSPIYTSIIIQDKDFTKVLEKYNKYVTENHKGISDLDKWAKEKNEKYNRKYKCKWQLALCGELEFGNFVNEEDMLKEMSDYHSDTDDDNVFFHNPN
jgi:hypothetical protein